VILNTSPKKQGDKVWAGLNWLRRGRRAQSVFRMGHGLQNPRIVFQFPSLPGVKTLFATPKRPDTQWVLGVIPSRANEPRCTADFPSPYRAQVKNEWS
jgi:hypothetical protein